MALKRAQTAIGFFLEDPLQSTQDSEPIISISAATTSDIGAVKPDGTTITVAPDGTISATGGGGGGGPTAQNDVTAERAFGTVYQNSGSQPIYVATALMTPGQVNAFTDSATPPVTLVANGGLPTLALADYFQFFFIVLPGNYYELIDVLGESVIQSWIEWN